MPNKGENYVRIGSYLIYIDICIFNYVISQLDVEFNVFFYRTHSKVDITDACYPLQQNYVRIWHRL